MVEYTFQTKKEIKCCGQCPLFHAESPMYCQLSKSVKITPPYGKVMKGCPLKKNKDRSHKGEIEKFAEAILRG